MIEHHVMRFYWYMYVIPTAFMTDSLIFSLRDKKKDVQTCSTNYAVCLKPSL